MNRKMMLIKTTTEITTIILPSIYDSLSGGEYLFDLLSTVEVILNFIIELFLLKEKLL